MSKAQNDQFLKQLLSNFQHKLNILSYYLIESPKLPLPLFLILNTLELIFCCLMPFEVLISFLASENTLYFANGNFVLWIAKQQSFSFITLAINSMLYLQFFILSLSILRFKTEAETNRQVQSSMHTFNSFLLLLNGKILLPLELSMQALQIRCSLQEGICYPDKSPSQTLILNSIGTFLSLLFYALHYRINTSVFPVQHDYTAGLQIQRAWIHQMDVILYSLLIIFQDLIITKVPFAVLLVPCLLISMVKAWFSVFRMYHFNSLVDNSTLFTQTLSLVFSVLAISVCLSKIQSNCIVLAITLITCISAFGCLYMLKRTTLFK